MRGKGCAPQRCPTPAPRSPQRAPRGLLLSPRPAPPQRSRAPLGNVECTGAQAAARQHRFRVGLPVADTITRRREPLKKTHGAATASSSLRRRKNRPPAAEAPEGSTRSGAVVLTGAESKTSGGALKVRPCAFGWRIRGFGGAAPARGVQRQKHRGCPSLASKQRKPNPKSAPSRRGGGDVGATRIICPQTATVGP